MPKTIVKCSVPQCKATATRRIAAPWSEGPFSELKTFGFACTVHAESVLANARQRPKSLRLLPDESLGEVATYPLPQQ